MIALFLSLLCVAANAFFVAAEFALAKVRPSSLEALAKQGDPDAARAALAASKYEVVDGRLVGEDGPVSMVITEVGGGAEAAIDTQAFLEQWRTELGLDVEIRQTDFATFLAEQDAIKKEKLQITFSYWDGGGHRRKVECLKGDTISQFLGKARDMLSN